MKIKCFIHARYDEYDGEYEFLPWHMDMTQGNHAGPLVGEHEFEFDPPSIETLTAGTIAQYRKEQKNILAEAEMKRERLEQMINNLLAIEYKP